MAPRAVCISHSTGADGEAAEWAELSPAFVADAERRKPLLDRMLGHPGGRSVAQPLPTGEPGRSAPTDADLRALITEALRSIADQGSVVIVAHAASLALGGPDVLRVLVTASPANGWNAWRQPRVSTRERRSA